MDTGYIWGKSMKRLAAIVIIFVFIFIFINSLPMVFAEGNTSGSTEKIYIVYDSSKLLISSKYGDKYLWMKFAPCGPNNIFSLSGLYLSKYQEPDLSKTYSTMVSSCSDWIGPYSFVNKDYAPSRDQNFTGGWHSGIINGKTVRTGYSKYVNLYINSKIVKYGFKGYCESAVVKVANYLKAHNTVNINKDSLYEHVEYTITPCRIGVNVEFTALDNINILRYYGLQSLDYYWKGKVVYGNSQSEAASSSVSSNSGKKSLYPDVSTITVFTKDQGEFMEMGIDRSAGIGDMRYVGEDQPCAFTESYKKSYFSLVFGKEFLMSKNDKASWSGYYRFGTN